MIGADVMALNTGSVSAKVRHVVTVKHHIRLNVNTCYIVRNFSLVVLEVVPKSEVWSVARVSAKAETWELPAVCQSSLSMK